MPRPNPYFESVRDVFVRAACEFYKLAADADFETADAEGYIRHGRTAERQAHEMWPVTVRQDRRMSSLRAKAEINTPEGRELRDRIIKKLAAGS
jgi:hypothetical protein